jgi:hypothetical protein
MPECPLVLPGGFAGSDVADKAGMDFGNFRVARRREPRFALDAGRKI